jgi:hypothetical protein
MMVIYGKTGTDQLGNASGGGMLLRDGQVAARRTGAAPAPALQAWVNETLASSAPGQDAHR